MTEILTNPLFMSAAIPVLSGICVLLARGKSSFLPQKIAFCGAAVSVIPALFMAVNFNPGAKGFQFLYKAPWTVPFNINFSIGTDGFGIAMILLTAALTAA